MRKSSILLAILVTLSLLFPNESFARQLRAEKLSRADSLFALAQDTEGRAESDEDFEQAKNYYLRSVGEYRVVGALQAAGRALVELYRLEKERGRFISAIEFLKMAAEDFELSGNLDAAAESWYDIGLGLSEESASRAEADSATTSFLRAIDLGLAAPSPGEGQKIAGWAMQEIARSLEEAGNLLEARASIETAISFYSLAGVGPDPLMLLDAGAIFANSDQPLRARELLREAWEAAKDSGDKETEGEALNGLGQVFLKNGRPLEARALFDSARVLQFENEDSVGLAGSTDGLANALDDLGRPREALATYWEALEYAVGGDQETWADVLGNLSVQVRFEIGPDSALTLMKEALPIHEDRDLGYFEGLTLQNIGLAYGDLCQLDTARTYLERGRIRRDEAGDPRGTFQAFRFLADLWHRNMASPDFQKALAYYDSAATIVEDLTSRAQQDEDISSFRDVTDVVTLFEEWALAVLEARVGEDAATGDLASLAIAERGRAQSLLMMMRDPLSTGLGYSASRLSPEHPNTSASRLSGAPVNIEDPLSELQSEGAELVRLVTDPDRTTVIYHVTTDHLLIWLVRSDRSVNTYRRPISRDRLTELVEDVRWSLGILPMTVVEGIAGTELDEEVRAQLGYPGTVGRDNRARCLGGVRVPNRGATNIKGRESPGALGLSEAGAELSRIIFPPELSEGLEGSELLIIPSGPLAALPFAALSLPEVDQPLGLSVALRFSPALAVFREVKNYEEPAQERISEGEKLVVGNPQMPELPVPGDSVALVPLPGAEREADSLAVYTGTSPLVGADASEGSIKRRIPDATLVHFATHGVAYADRARSRDSFVALAPDGQEDGFLTVREVLELPRLKAVLVTLSACQTGLGAIRESEGIIGLQRAFLARGAESVLVSLWKVDDEATEALMTAFYRHWLRDSDAPSKATALLRAQKEVAETESDPRVWAAFQLVGGG